MFIFLQSMSWLKLLFLYEWFIHGSWNFTYHICYEVIIWGNEKSSWKLVTDTSFLIYVMSHNLYTKWWPDLDNSSMFQWRILRIPQSLSLTFLFNNLKTFFILCFCHKQEEQEAYLGPRQASMIETFAKIVKAKFLQKRKNYKYLVGSRTTHCISEH